MCTIIDELSLKANERSRFFDLGQYHHIVSSFYNAVESGQEWLGQLRCSCTFLQRWVGFNTSWIIPLSRFQYHLLHKASIWCCGKLGVTNSNSNASVAIVNRHQYTNAYMCIYVFSERLSPKNHHYDHPLNFARAKIHSIRDRLQLNEFAWAGHPQLGVFSLTRVGCVLSTESPRLPGFHAHFDMVVGGGGWT